MSIRLAALLVLATSAILAACTAPSGGAAKPVTDWNFTNLPPADDTPKLSRTERHTNPPPPPVYADYMDEPTRFEFHRHIITFDENGDEMVDQGAADEGGGDEGY